MEERRKVKMMNDQTIEIVQDNFTAGGKLIRASFLFVDGGRVTVCILHDYMRKDAKSAPISGLTCCHPKEEISRTFGMREALRRACYHIDHPNYYNIELGPIGRSIYDAYRKHLHEAEKPAHFVIYNHEVRGVTDKQHAAWIAIVDGELGACGKDNGFTCSRGPGHSGLHIAVGCGVYQVWDDGVELSFDEWSKLRQEIYEREAKK